MKHKLLIFDCDGTIRASKSGALVPKSPDDVFILPYAQSFFDLLHMSGHRPFVALASNQAGVGQHFAASIWRSKATGDFAKWCDSILDSRLSESQTEAVMQATADMVKADLWLMSCIWHPKSGKTPPYPTLANRSHRNATRWYETFRKPAPGMINYIMQTLEVDPSKTLVIGDMADDAGAAASAGADFVLANEFFKVPEL